MFNVNFNSLDSLFKSKLFNEVLSLSFFCISIYWFIISFASFYFNFSNKRVWINILFYPDNFIMPFFSFVLLALFIFFGFFNIYYLTNNTYRTSLFFNSLFLILYNNKKNNLKFYDLQNKYSYLLFWWWKLFINYKVLNLLTILLKEGVIYIHNIDTFWKNTNYDKVFFQKNYSNFVFRLSKYWIQLYENRLKECKLNSIIWDIII